MFDRKVRVFKPGESLNTIFSARQFGLCLAVDVMEALKDFPSPTLGSDAYEINKWIKKWFSDVHTSCQKVNESD